MINAEYLPETMNRDTNPQFRAARGASKWKLNPTVFQKISSRWGLPEMDLFAPFFSWKLDSFREGSNAFQVSREHRKGYAFPPFSLIGRVLKVLTDQATLILITPAWQAQIMVFKVPTNVNKASASSPQNLNSFDSPKRGYPSLGNKRKIVTPGMDSFRKMLSADNISLLTETRRSGANFH